VVFVQDIAYQAIMVVLVKRYLLLFRFEFLGESDHQSQWDFGLSWRGRAGVKIFKLLHYHLQEWLVDAADVAQPRKDQNLRFTKSFVLI
jgi:hypothetical protein